MKHIYSRIMAIFVAVATIGLFIALWSYSATDTTFFFSSTNALGLHNSLGWFGAQTAAFLFYFFGGGAYGFCLVGAFWAWSLATVHLSDWAHKRLVPLVGLVITATITLRFYALDTVPGTSSGGLVGRLLFTGLLRIADRDLIAFMLYGVMLILMVLIAGCSWVAPLLRWARACIQRSDAPLWVAQSLAWSQKKFWHAWRMPFSLRKKKEVEVPVDQDFEAVVQSVYNDTFWQEYTQGTAPQGAAPVVNSSSVTLGQEAPVLPLEPELANLAAQTMVDPIGPVLEPYSKPDVLALRPKRPEALSAADRKEQQAQAHLLEEKLSKFGIRGSVVKITSGPVVTLFEYQPQIDVPISKIVAREDDLALALQAMSLRIIAPIPGTAVIGFEVSNIVRKMVLFSEAVNGPLFTASAYALPLIIGQDTRGAGCVIDLASMPHLLVAGSTGSGKSVALNVMLLSFLCHASPDEIRLILIDPKRLEFSLYADVPHLLFPIITEAKRAIMVLSWAVKTMEERYALMAAAGARNIHDYRKIHKNSMPYIVIVIDELADLMIVAGKDIEVLIARLAQMARAAGIHLIIATQRPSVDVITGVIKVNFPVRLACKVTSKVDSRTILDSMGAEKLLGKGDMLLLDGQGRLQRLHGAYVSNEEINYIVQQVKAQRAVVYHEIPEGSGESELPSEDAALYKEVVDFVRTTDEISISLLQRKFRIGYNRSARMIDLLENHGVIMPASGGKGRKVLH